MPQSLDKLLDRFQRADRATRLEALLDWSRRLPPLPTDLEPDREQHRVPECQTPVYLWVAVENGAVRVLADVPRESPTVRGFVAILVAVADGAAPAAVLSVPDDLLHALGLDEALGMMRLQGLSAIVRRVKRAVRERSDPPRDSASR